MPDGERRCRSRCRRRAASAAARQRLCVGSPLETARDARAQQRPDDEQGDWEGSEGRERCSRAARVVESVLGLCLPAQAVPRLVRDDDGLRRSPSLPRAVREPLPPGLPGEVQGIAARRRLVAPQPARSARRLPASSSGSSSRTRRSRTTRSTCSPGSPAGSSSRVSLQSAARSMVDSAELIKKVRFPRQLVAFSMVATQAVTFARDARDPDRALARLRSRRAGDGLGRRSRWRSSSLRSSPGSRCSSPA